jgi:ABC-type amino acid transport substrate-binding protein
MDENLLTRRSFAALAAIGIVQCAALGSATALAQTTSGLDAIKKRGSLRIGWGVWVPYMFLDPKTRELTGITVAIGNAMGQHLGVKAEFVQTTWATMVAGLQAGQYDMTMPFIITEERLKAVTFTDPVLKSNWCLVVPESAVKNYQSWHDLNKPGMRISATLGSSAPQFLNLLDKSQHLLMKDGSDSIAQLLTGQADAWLTQYDAFRTAQQQHPGLGVVPGPSIGEQDVAFAITKGDTTLKAALDGEIAELKRSGALLKMITKYGLNESSIA